MQGPGGMRAASPERPPLPVPRQDSLGVGPIPGGRPSSLLLSNAGQEGPGEVPTRPGGHVWLQVSHPLLRAEESEKQDERRQLRFKTKWEKGKGTSGRSCLEQGCETYRGRRLIATGMRKGGPAFPSPWPPDSDHLEYSQRFQRTGSLVLSEALVRPLNDPRVFLMGRCPGCGVHGGGLK